MMAHKMSDTITTPTMELLSMISSGSRPWPPLIGGGIIRLPPLRRHGMQGKRLPGRAHRTPRSLATRQGAQAAHQCRLGRSQQRQNVCVCCSSVLCCSAILPAETVSTCSTRNKPLVSILSKRHHYPARGLGVALVGDLAVAGCALDRG